MMKIPFSNWYVVAVFLFVLNMFIEDCKEQGDYNWRFLYCYIVIVENIFMYSATFLQEPMLLFW